MLKITAIFHSWILTISIENIYAMTNIIFQEKMLTSVFQQTFHSI